MSEDSRDPGYFAERADTERFDTLRPSQDWTASQADILKAMREANSGQQAHDIAAKAARDAISKFRLQGPGIHGRGDRWSQDLPVDPVLPYETLDTSVPFYETPFSCDTCNQCQSCESCVGGCDPCVACLGCEDCESCVEGCDSCVGCQDCHAGCNPSCEDCHAACNPACDQCQPCNPTCNGCEPCNPTCNGCEPCQQCNSQCNGCEYCHAGCETCLPSCTSCNQTMPGM